MLKDKRYSPVQFHASTLAEKKYPFAENLCAFTLSVSAHTGIALGSFVSSELQEFVRLQKLGFWAALLALAALAANIGLVRALCKAPRGSCVSA